MITVTMYIVQGLKYVLLGLIPSSIIVSIFYLVFANGSESAKVSRSNIIKLFISIWYLSTLLQIVFIGRWNNSYSGINLDPFLCYRQMFVSFSVIHCLNVITNIALFIPFGYMFAIPFQKRRLSWLVLPIGLILSVMIEIIQYYLFLGIADVDDIFNNFLGVLIGFCVFRWICLRGKSRSAWLYLLIGVVPVLVLGSSYVGYLAQDYGNFTYEAYYGHSLKNSKISFEDAAFDVLLNEPTLQTYRVLSGTKEEALMIAKEVFTAYDTQIGEDVSEYDDCIVIYDETHTKCIWYTYEGGTYTINDYVRISIEDDYAISITEEEVRKSLLNLYIALPESTAFEYIGDSTFRFTFRLLPNGLNIIDGYVTCSYSEGYCHDICYNILTLSLASAETHKAPDEETIRERIQLGQFYLQGEIIYQEFDTLTIHEATLNYDIDSKGFYRPVLYLLAEVDSISGILIIPI